MSKPHLSPSRLLKISIMLSIIPNSSSYSIMHKILNTRDIKVKANSQVTLRANGTKIIRTSDCEDIRIHKNKTASLDWGTFLPNSPIHRQHFPIRSYEIGPNGTVTLEALMNLLQESGVNCMKSTGTEVDGLAIITPEMYQKNIIWVIAKIQVEIDRYPTSRDFLEVDNWSATKGSTGIRSDALIRNYETGHTLLRASRYCLFVNRDTKKVTRIPNDVREKLAPYMIDMDPIVKEDDKLFPKVEETTVNFICGTLNPRWTDLDDNQHVNNAKYISWIFESVPRWILNNYELCRITMEYRRECHVDNVVKYKTTIITRAGPKVECSHLLTLENGPTIITARTSWRPKFVHIRRSFL